MIKTMPIKYCYKAIHSFFFNFYNINEYDKIKSIILNINAPADDFEKDVKKYHNATILIFNSKKLCFDDFISSYRYTAGADDVVFFEYIADILRGDIFSKCSTLCRDIRQMNRTNAYYAYLIILKKLCEYFKDYFFIPITFAEKIADLENDTIRKYYIKGWFHNLAELNEIHSDNLLSRIQNCYIDKIETFPQIKHLYLFGSIPSGMYHRESDVDMVVEFKGTPTYYVVHDTFEEIKGLNKHLFNLDTDIYEINQFMESNSHLSLTKIF